MSVIKNIGRYLLYREKATSKSFIKFLRHKGVQIGDNCTFYGPRTSEIDYQNPGLLQIGNYVRVSDGVRILTHDYSLSVVAGKFGDVIGSVKPTVIGNNVFIGMAAIILGGVTIGNNVIIGAGSIVTKDCMDDSVYAGNPAKRICSIDELYKKRKRLELDNGKKVARFYYTSTGKHPDETVLREYLELFSSRKEIPEELDKLFQDSGSYEQCKTKYFNSKPIVSSIDKLFD